jgi:hypothetical protein
MKTPTDATKVYNAALYNFNAFTTAGFPVDFLFARQYTSSSNDWRAIDRLRGGMSLNPNTTSAESAEDYWKLDNSTGVNNVLGSGGVNNYANWMFRRAPGFFDVVAYAGTGSARTVSHNLGVVPELMIVKASNSGFLWVAYSAATGNTRFLELNSTAAADISVFWNNTSPTANVFTVNGSNAVNGSGYTYIAYLFASCPGVSKVGSYTGTGTTLDINCGFTAGARFVLIKRTNSTGDWFVWDTARGIISGNDPYLLLNSTAAEVTSTDYIDPLSSGFQISSTAPAAINANGGSFIFLAVA